MFALICDIIEFGKAEIFIFNTLIDCLFTYLFPLARCVPKTRELPLNLDERKTDNFFFRCISLLMCLFVCVIGSCAWNERGSYTNAVCSDHFIFWCQFVWKILVLHLCLNIFVWWILFNFDYNNPLVPPPKFFRSSFNWIINHTFHTQKKVSKWLILIDQRWQAYSL